MNRIALLIGPITATVTLLLAGTGSVKAAGDFPPLNSPSTSNEIPGKFVWADLFTNNPESAAHFYSELLGWTSEPIDRGNSYVLSNKGRPVAGVVMRRRPAATRGGVWVAYISVPKLTDAAGAINAGGGIERAHTRDFPRRGMEAIFSDGEGSVVGIIQSSSGDPADVEPRHGDWDWFELYSIKPQAAGDFYRQALGYDVHPDDRPGKGDRLILSSGGRARGGIAPLPAAPNARPGWLGCVRVRDIDEMAAKATALGGKVLVAPRPAELGSRFAVVADPTDGAIALLQYVAGANPADRP